MKRIIVFIISLQCLFGVAQNYGEIIPFSQWRLEDGVAFYQMITLNDSLKLLHIEGHDLFYTGVPDSTYPSDNHILKIPDSIFTGYETVRHYGVVGWANLGPDVQTIDSSPVLMYSPDMLLRLEALSIVPEEEDTELTFYARIYLKKTGSQQRQAITKGPSFAPVSFANLTVYQNRLSAYSPSKATIQIVRMDDGYIHASNAFTGSYYLDFNRLKPGFYSALIIEENGAKTQKKFTVQ
jgi:hypothetical protein